jgi:anti-anti-sigma regulatory factor
VGIALNQDGNSSLLELDGAIDISVAADLKAGLLRAIEAGQEIRVSVEKADELDITAVQLLWAARREAARRGVAFSVAGTVPESIRRDLANAGLTGFGVLE